MDTNILNWDITDVADRQVIWFNIQDFLDLLVRPWAIDPDNLTVQQEAKAGYAKEHFERGSPMDPSDVQGLSDDGRIVVEGRHRLVAAMQLGETYAPFSVPLDMVDYFWERKLI